MAQEKFRRYRILLLVFLLVFSLLISLFAVVRCTRDPEAGLDLPTSGQTTGSSIGTSSSADQTTASIDPTELPQAEIADIDNFDPSDYA